MSVMAQQVTPSIRYLMDESEQVIHDSLQRNGVVILPPMDVKHSLCLMRLLKMKAKVVMLDPWYNKGVGGVRDDYRDFIDDLLEDAGAMSEHVFLWGFPEIVACFVERIPQSLNLVAWLTWYYKNNPSVIRGWRSAQMACLHVARPDAKMYPEHFLNDAQKRLKDKGKLRYMPGPTSVIEEPSTVIEAPLNIGFVGKKEQTGHPAQKPVAVFKKLYEMTTEEKDLIFDPMSGSGTTGSVACDINRFAVICDGSDEYTRIAETRLGVERTTLNPTLVNLLRSGEFVAELTRL